MKRKSLILGTLGATFLLAGSVFAAYSVTDNAAKQGVRISPGTISTDAVGSVELEWGENSVANVQNLAVGTPQTRYVTVKATTAGNDSNVYLGSLEVSIEDISGKAAGAKKLIDYLQVVVKGYTYNSTDGFATEKSTLATLNKDNTEATLGVHANKTGKQVEFEISLLSTATPYISVINTDQVYLTIDWNRGASDDAGTKRVYIPKPSGWNKLYVYSYGTTGENAPWPGVELTEKEGDNYIADLIDTHDNFIFSDNGDNSKRHPAEGADGMTRTSMELNTAGNIYFDWATHKFVAEATYPYYLVGEETDAWSTLAANGLSVADSSIEDTEHVAHQWKGVLTVVANKDYKICSADKTTTWAGFDNIETDAKTLVTNSDGNFKFKAAGTYDIYLKQWKDGGFSIYLAAHSA